MLGYREGREKTSRDIVIALSGDAADEGEFIVTR